MSQKVAVAIVHGIGKQGPDFYEGMKADIVSRCKGVCSDDIVVEPVYWARVMQDTEDELWKRMVGDGKLAYLNVRNLMIDFVADALAYQPTTHDRRAYDDIHAEFAASLRRLAVDAGEKAPLCIIAHSLGTVITSNFVYDLQNPDNISKRVRDEMKDTPFDRGETLTLLYTMGSPLALWSLRFLDFGKPITIPSPLLDRHYLGLKGEWVNYYDRDDVVAYPLKLLNKEYEQAVTADAQVNVGDLFSSWNPMSHLGYWNDRDVLDPISKAITRVWQSVNP